MKIEVRQLQELGYKEKDSLDHQALIPFVQTYLKKRTRSSMFFNIANICFLASLTAFFSYNYFSEKFSFGDGLTYLSFGVAISLLLIPIHEFLHVLAYKYVGAKNTSYDANLKKFYFMAIADQFVANRKEFQIVALTPFVAVCITCFIALFFVSGLWVYTILSVLLVHTNFCSGDFALLSYFDFHQDQELVTYDDKSNGISYFYVR